MFSSFDKLFYIFILLGVSCLILPCAAVQAEDQKSQAPAQAGLQQRIDFGNAQILGQSIKSGAVYLMHRKKSDIKNMLELRQHYRDEIKEDFGLIDTAIVSSPAASEKAAKK